MNVCRVRCFLDKTQSLEVHRSMMWWKLVETEPARRLVQIRSTLCTAVLSFAAHELFFRWAFVVTRPSFLYGWRKDPSVELSRMAVVCIHVTRCRPHGTRCIDYSSYSKMKEGKGALEDVR